MTRAYYNEIDPYAAQWIRHLIDEKVIPKGDVDTRSIADVSADDLKGYTQWHFFAGICGWPLALRQAGWEDDREIWSGSCPCQPFSVAGKGDGKDDPRHLWPTWFRLIGACRPKTIFGEQVCSTHVIGRTRDTNEDLSMLWASSFFGSVLQELERPPSRAMYPVCDEKSTGSQEKIEKEELVRFSKMERREAGVCSLQRGEKQGEDKRDSFFSESRRHTETDRPRGVRTNGTPVQDRERTNLGQPFTRSRKPEEGIHSEKYEGRDLGDKRHEEQLRDEYRGNDNARLSEKERTKGGKQQTDKRFSFEIPRTGEDGWLDLVQNDLENCGYAVGHICAPACCVGAPHIRKRLWFVADRPFDRRGQGNENRTRDSKRDQAERSAGRTPLGRHALELAHTARSGSGTSRTESRNGPHRTNRISRGVFADNVAHADEDRFESRGKVRSVQEEQDAEHGRPTLELAHTDHARQQGRGRAERGQLWQDGSLNALRANREPQGTRPTDGFWRDVDWLLCRDGRWRCAEPGSQPLVDGLPAGMGSVRAGETSPYRTILDPRSGKPIGQAPWRVGMLRAYGNSIPVPLAMAFIEEYMSLNR